MYPTRNLLSMFLADVNNCIFNKDNNSSQVPHTLLLKYMNIDCERRFVELSTDLNFNCPDCSVTRIQGHPTTVLAQMLLNAVLGYLEYF